MQRYGTKQGWEFALLLFALSLFRSFALCCFAVLLLSCFALLHFCSFALLLFCSFHFFEHKSDSLFMKELFTLYERAIHSF